MTRNELIEALATRRSIPRSTAEEIVAVFFEEMEEQLCSGGRIEVRGFGSFQVRQYDGYVGRNPRTGLSIDVKPKRLPHFKPGKRLRAVVSGEEDRA